MRRVLDCSARPVKRPESYLSPPLGERRENGPRARAGEGGGDAQARLEAPVWALAIRSGQVGLDCFADEVVELGVGEDRASAADQRVNRGGEGAGERGFLARRGGEKSRGEKRVEKPAFLLAPRGDRLVRLGQGQTTEHDLLADVGASPPAGESRQVMGRNAGYRHGRIAGWRAHPRAVALEPQHPHAVDIGAGEPVAEAVGDSAEVLADHHASSAFALEREAADEIVERIGEIGAFRRARAFRDEEEALEPHGVIDPQHAGVPHVGAQDRAQGGPALARAGQRIERRQAPVLPFGGKRIGRRSDGDLARERASMRPGFGAVWRGADREIAVEADFEAPAPRAFRGAGELPVGEPLAEEREFERLTVALDRRVDRLGLAVAQVLRPNSPVLAKLAVGSRLEGGEAPESFAALSGEGVVIGDERVRWPRRAEAGEGR